MSQIRDIQLSEAQRQQLQQMLRAGNAPARRQTRTRILLLSDAKPGDWRSAPAVAKLIGEIEAELTRLACSEPPADHTRWTLRLLADRLVELTSLESVSHNTVGEWLKKTRSSPGK